MQRQFKINVNGTNYDVAVEELAPSFTPQASAPVSFTAVPAASVAAPVVAPSPAAVPAGAGNQCAQMGGVVASIAVKEGQSVNEGERIAELEAMKMKVPVTASCSGKVTRILVAVGDAVESGQVLVVIA